MQFIKDGPEIPERLLQAHEEGRVVFFCGAGVSYPAGLPGFGGLVDLIFDGLGTKPNEVEQTALNGNSFDTAIGLLEGRITGGRRVVRRELARRLEPDLARPAATTTHDALLTLARSRTGHLRIITTNFDRLFELVGSRHSGFASFRAPLLPVPKNRWDGLVYLHGLLDEVPTDNALNQLVVSSGDFGLAYLTERWASRFVTELFRTYTICFVGYSLSDPVMRYMMDALAADRSLGESPPEAFAFGSFRAGDEDPATNQWLAKNVTPIMYAEDRSHSLLHDTLRTWSDTYRDGVRGKEAIVIRYAITRPLASTKQDDHVGRMLWALADPSGLPARRFAEFDPLPSLDWLSPLTENRFGHSDLSRFGVAPAREVDKALQFSLLDRPTPYTHSPRMLPVLRLYDATGRWDNVMSGLAAWLVRHLDDPTLLLWVAKRGGTLHPNFRHVLRHALTANQPRPAMEHLWDLCLAGRLKDKTDHRDIYDWYRRFAQRGLTIGLRRELLTLLEPKAVFEEPFRYEDDPGPDDEPRRHFRWDLALAADHVSLVVRDNLHGPAWQLALPDLLQPLTGLLLQAYELLDELGATGLGSDLSYIYQPSIAPHPQNNDFHDWTVLIVLVRDAWLEAASRFPQLARGQVQYWLSLRYPVFRRLAFFAATESSLFPPEEAVDWLLDDDARWLWSSETQRETARLVSRLAPGLGGASRDRLMDAIVAGPPRDENRSEESTRLRTREVWRLLATYKDSGGKLTKRAGAKLGWIRRKYPNWLLRPDQRDDFPYFTDSGDEWTTNLTVPPTRSEIERWLENSPPTDMWTRDNWRERCQTDFPRTATALLALARRGTWPVQRWREALQAWGTKEHVKKSWRHLGRVVSDAPGSLLKEIDRSIAWWIQEVGPVIKGRSPPFERLVGRLVETLKNRDVEDDHDDPLFKAINDPAGLITEGALQYWYGQGLNDGQGLGDFFASLFTDLANPSIKALWPARLLLARNAISLFRVDPDWTLRKLLPLFDWVASADQALVAWTGYLWSPRFYPPLMAIFKDNFLATSQFYLLLDKYGQQYTSLLAFAALEGNDLLNHDEISAAVQALPPKGLEELAEALVRLQSGAQSQRADYWENRTRPFVGRYWPKSADHISPAIASSFAQLIVETGDAFPRALEFLQHWIVRPVNVDQTVSRLSENGFDTRFPSESLALLDLLIHSESQWLPLQFAGCLKSIATAEPAIQADERFRRLEMLLRQRTP